MAVAIRATSVRRPTDLRSTTIGIGGSALGSQAENLLGGALRNLGTSGGTVGYRPVAGPSFGSANQYFDQAINRLGGIGISGGGAVAGPNFGQAQRYMNQAAGQVGGINIGGVNLPALSNLSKTQGLLNQAQGAYQGLGLKQYGTIKAQDPSQAYAGLAAALAQSHTPGQDELRRIAMGQVRDLASAPDRAQLAARALALQRQMTTPAWQQDLRAAGQQAAALGRIGAGMTTNELNDITLAREKALGQYGEDAALQAAGMEMQDRLNRLGATAGYQGQITAEDLARAGFTQGNALARFGVGSTVRGQNVDERNFQAQQAMNTSQIAAARAGGLAGLVGNQYAVDTTGFNQGLQRSNLDLNVQQARAQAAAQRAGIYSGLGGQSAQMAQATTQNAQQNAARALQASGMRADIAQQQAQMMYGVGGQRANQAIASAGFASDQAGRQLQASLANMDNKRQYAGMLAGIQGQMFGQSQARAQLASQQQGRQDTLAQQSIDNRVRQAVVQDQLLNSQFGRQLSASQAAGGLGYGNDPYQMQLAAAAQQQAQAASQRSGLEQAAQAAAMARALGMLR